MKCLSIKVISMQYSINFFQKLDLKNLNKKIAVVHNVTDYDLTMR